MTSSKPPRSGLGLETQTLERLVDLAIFVEEVSDPEEMEILINEAKDILGSIECPVCSEPATGPPELTPNCLESCYRGYQINP